MSGIEWRFGTGRSSATGRRSLMSLASAVVFLLLATSGSVQAEPLRSEAATQDARMVRTPAQLAAFRDRQVLSSTHGYFETRADDVAMLSTLTNYNPFEQPVPDSTDAMHKQTRPVVSPDSTWRLPEPDGWTAVAATLALAVFFFLRRLA